MGKSTNLEVIRKVGELTDNIELMAKDAKKELKYIDSVLLRYASFYNKKSKQVQINLSIEYKELLQNIKKEKIERIKLQKKLAKEKNEKKRSILEKKIKDLEEKIQNDRLIIKKEYAKQMKQYSKTLNSLKDKRNSVASTYKKAIEKRIDRLNKYEEEFGFEYKLDDKFKKILNNKSVQYSKKSKSLKNEKHANLRNKIINQTLNGIPGELDYRNTFPVIIERNFNSARIYYADRNGNVQHVKDFKEIDTKYKDEDYKKFLNNYLNIAEDTSEYGLVTCSVNFLKVLHKFEKMTENKFIDKQLISKMFLDVFKSNSKEKYNRFNKFLVDYCNRLATNRNVLNRINKNINKRTLKKCLIKIKQEEEFKNIDDAKLIQALKIKFNRMSEDLQSCISKFLEANISFKEDRTYYEKATAEDRLMLEYINNSKYMGIGDKIKANYYISSAKHNYEDEIKNGADLTELIKKDKILEYDYCSSNSRVQYITNKRFIRNSKNNTEIQNNYNSMVNILTNEFGFDKAYDLRSKRYFEFYDKKETKENVSVDSKKSSLDEMISKKVEEANNDRDENRLER